jgi:hypothetical protein
MPRLSQSTHLLAFLSLDSLEPLYNTTLDFDQIAYATTKSASKTFKPITLEPTSTDLQEHKDKGGRTMGWKVISKKVELSMQVPAVAMAGPNSISGQQCVVM